jgi:D-alanine--poly(phosphoribitol) ligase subunit 2
MKERLLEIIIAVAGELNENLESKIPVELGEKAALYGADAALTSLGLVSLIVGVEQAIEEEFGRNITLADDKAFSLTKSPFLTIGTLAEYANNLIEKNS